MLDASAMVDLLTDPSAGELIRFRLEGTAVHVPAHFDAEVFSAAGRLCRAGRLTDNDVVSILGVVRRAPFTRHLVHNLIEGAWSRHNTHSLLDALYVELAEQLRAPLITTDRKLATSYPQAQVP
nr:type II toxin-antitoxin system VapC family toxin [Mycobacterium kyorinense]